MTPEAAGLPAGWAATSLGRIRIDRGRTVDPRETPEQRYELYSVPSHAEGRPEILVGREIGSTKQTLEPGTVVVCKINPRINRVWVVGDRTPHPKIGSSEWIPFFPMAGVDSHYLAHYMRQGDFRNYLAANVSGVGGSLMRVRPAVIDAFPFRLAPEREQRELVEVIDSYVSRVDKAEAALERVQRNLKRYRAAVLQAAVGGRLVPTEAELARAEGRDYEPASDLLKRILAERRRRWEEAELSRLTATGKSLKDDKWKTAYADPEPPAIDDLPGLPEGWCWTSVGQIGEVSGGLTKHPKRDSLPAKFPYLRVANVYANELRLSDVETIGIAEAEMARTLLHRGDLLVVEGNGSLEQIGRVALWDGSIDPCVHQNHIIKVRFPTASMSGWVLWSLLSPSGRGHIQRVASSTSGLHTLSLSKVASLPLPLPPAREQRRIQAEVDRRLSLATGADECCVQARRRSGRLRQAILKCAFEGRLIDQDPSDEPASVLLERIRAERARANVDRPRTRRTRARKER